MLLINLVKIIISLVLLCRGHEMPEEDELSEFFSEDLKCDACKVVAFQIHLALVKAHANTRRLLNDVQLIDLFDAVCQEHNFFEYGLLCVTQSRPRLVGWGLKEDPLPPQQHEKASVAKMGKIPRRFSQLCQSLLEMPDQYEFPEKVIYDQWMYFGQSEKSISDFLCLESANDEDRKRSACSNTR